ncbi:cell cycle control protein 50A-like [Carassius carassius]|uniref:cell cycle control protein 50A-like n=1 Tax=Carassius carassius TaxID=217509 RepID=UPI002868D296|nr:cell cycle control protein 50A-like [Carassius carassius]
MVKSTAVSSDCNKVSTETVLHSPHCVTASKSTSRKAMSSITITLVTKAPARPTLSVGVSYTSKPVNWSKPVYELDPSGSENNGFINEDFIMWMRTAALPTFRKLYRIIQKKDNMTPTLPPGNYSLDVTYSYPLHSFDGRKRMILSTISWMGGKNPFLGIAYITVGSVCFFLGVVLLIIHHEYGNRNNNADIPN